jgi:hypothetical protein
VKLEFKPQEIEYPNGLEIAVDGFTGDPGGVKPSQVLVQVYESNLRVHVWTDGSDDPTVSAQIQPLSTLETDRPFSAGMTADAEEALTLLTYLADGKEMGGAIEGKVWDMERVETCIQRLRESLDIWPASKCEPD